MLDVRVVPLLHTGCFLDGKEMPYLAMSARNTMFRANPPSDDFFWPVISFGALLASDFVDGVLARRLGSNPWGASLGNA